MSNTKPQLSEEMNRRIDNELGNLDITLLFGDMKIIKHFLATALEEQRKGFKKDLEKIIGNREVYVFPPGVEIAYAMYANKEMAVKGMCINGDIAILNGKEKE